MEFEEVSSPWIYEGPASPAKKPAQSTVPNLDLKKVSKDTPSGDDADGSKSQRGLMTTALIGTAALGIAVTAGILLNKQRASQ